MLTLELHFCKPSLGMLKMKTWACLKVRQARWFEPGDALRSQRWQRRSYVL